MTLSAQFIVAVCCALAYCIGSIPFGLVLGKMFGLGDIRKIGSGNIGATNMLRTGNKPLAAATLLLDFLKGIFAIAAAQGLCNYYFSTQMRDLYSPPNVMYLAGVAAVFGHIFPVWLKFKGGKGVATTLGVLIATYPPIGESTIAGWMLIFYLTRVSSLSALGSIVCAPVLGCIYANADFTMMAAVIAVVVIFRHKENIIKLRQGTETKWEKKNDPS